MFTKPSQYLSAGCWVYLFASGWLMFVGSVPADTKAWFLFGFFFVVAVFSGAVASGKAKTQ